jgi:proline dehydrogenase
MSATIPDFNNTQLAFASKSNVELTRDYVMFRLMNNQQLVNTGIKLAAGMLEAGLSAPVTWGMKPTAYSVFCGGPSLQEARKKIDNLKRFDVDSILDYGVEGKETEADFERTATEIHKAIDFAAVNDATQIVCSKFTGLIPFHTLESLHKGSPLSKSEHAEYMHCVDRINSICAHAAEKKVALFVDAEESWIQKPLDDLTSSLMKKYNRERPIVYNTIQLYLKDRLEFFKTAHANAEKEGYIYAAKLVRGAYMEKESVRAKKLHYENPVQPSKEATDRDYNNAVEYALKNVDTIAVCIATHNEESCRLAVSKMNELSILPNHPHVTFSQLLGMSDHLSFNLAESGFRSAKYMPYGPVKDVIPYLIRRAQENASVSGQMGRELQLLTSEMKRRKLLPRFM